MAIIGITGFIGSGKDTAAEYFVEQLNYRQDSYAASVKDVCAIMFDWPRHLLEGDTIESRQWRNEPDQWWSHNIGIPDFTPRKAMQIIGTDLVRNHFHKNLWMLTVQRRFEATGGNTIISDARFVNEIQFIQNLGGKILHISNGTSPVWESIAIDAANGDTHATKIMEREYAHVHRSEWEWLAVEPDFTVGNTGTLPELYKNLQNVQSEITYSK